MGKTNEHLFNGGGALHPLNNITLALSHLVIIVIINDIFISNWVFIYLK